MTEMNPEAKALWIAALRSGNFNQGRGNLRYKQDGQDLHCCLGVLMDIAVEQGVEKATLLIDDSYGYGYGHIETCTLTEKVAEWAGVEHIGSLPDGTTVQGPDGALRWSLVGMNDSGSFTFEDIANVIEKEF